MSYLDLLRKSKLSRLGCRDRGMCTFAKSLNKIKQPLFRARRVRPALPVHPRNALIRLLLLALGSCRRPWDADSTLQSFPLWFPAAQACMLGSHLDNLTYLSFYTDYSPDLLHNSLGPVQNESGGALGGWFKLLRI